MGGGVEQRPDAPAVGHRQDYLLGPHRLGDAQRLGQRQLIQGDLPAVVPADCHDLQELLGRLVRVSQAVDDPSHLPVDRHGLSRPGVEDHHAHGRGVYERLQVGPDPQLLPQPPGVGDDQRRLGGEHDQRLLVLGAELPARLSLRKEDMAHPLPHVKDRRRQQRQRGSHLHGRLEVGKALRPDVAQQVGQSQGSLAPAEVLEEPHPVLQRPHRLGFLCGQPGGQEVLYIPGVVQQDEGPVAGAGEGPGAVQDPLQHGVQFQALVDAQADLAQPGQPVSGGLDLPALAIVVIHLRTSAWAGGSTSAKTLRKLPPNNFAKSSSVQPLA